MSQDSKSIRNQLFDLNPQKRGHNENLTPLHNDSTVTLVKVTNQEESKNLIHNKKLSVINEEESYVHRTKKLRGITSNNPSAGHEQIGEDILTKYPDTVARMVSVKNTESPENQKNEVQFSQISSKNKQGDALQIEEIALNYRCPICFESIDDQNFRSLCSCFHKFHVTCLSEFIKIRIFERKFPIPCPQNGCKTDLTTTDLKELLDEELQEKFYEYSLRKYIESHPSEMSFCLTPDCGFAFLIDPIAQALHCPLCGYSYCLWCKSPMHDGMTCKEYQITQKKDENDEKFQKLVTKKEYKKCPKCGAWVEKSGGCNHMSCTCAFEFCYKCGKARYMIFRQIEPLEPVCNCQWAQDPRNNNFSMYLCFTIFLLIFYRFIRYLL